MKYFPTRLLPEVQVRMSMRLHVGQRAIKIHARRRIWRLLVSYDTRRPDVLTGSICRMRMRANQLS